MPVKSIHGAVQDFAKFNDVVCVTGYCVDVVDVRENMVSDYLRNFEKILLTLTSPQVQNAFKMR